MDNTERAVSSINECFRMGIPVLPPDINRSGEFFTIDNEGETPGLRIGLAAIKTVGEGAVRPLVEERKENGPYLSMDDFCRRAGSSGLNRRTMESLVRAGAFDGLGPRGAVLDALDRILATAQREAQSRSSGQSSLFDGGNGGDSAQMPGIVVGTNDVSPEQKSAWERELLGVGLSHNPLMALSGLEAEGAINAADQIDEELAGQPVVVLGYVSTTTERSTREGKRFLIIGLELLGGSLEVMVWPDTLQRTAEVWQEGRLVRISGKVRARGDQISLVCDDAEEYVADQPSQLAAPEPAPVSANGNGKNGHGKGNGRSAKSNGNGNGNGAAATKPAATANGQNGRAESTRLVSLGVTESDDPTRDALLLREVIGVILEYPGRDRVNLNIRTGGKRVLMDLAVVSTGYCDSLHERLEALLGPDTVAVYQEMPLGIEPPPF